MIVLRKTDARDPYFVMLVKGLDKELAIRDGEDHAFYNQYNKIDAIKYVIVGYMKERPIACGAIKKLDEKSMEVKRMYVVPEERGKGVASRILKELEQWTVELGFNNCKLETGKKQPEAIALYLKNNYEIIENYGQYRGVANSVCFQKELA